MAILHRFYCSVKSSKFGIIFFVLVENKARHLIHMKYHAVLGSFNSFLASDDFCRLLITFANSLDPDQDRQNVGPDLVSIYLTLC